MTWEVRLHDAFEAEFAVLEPDVQTELLAVAKLLSDYGPLLGRPYVDTLNGSKHANMKEMRFSAADGEWRTAFAFDPERRAILLVAGDKSGGSQQRFYKQLITKADSRFSEPQEKLTDAKKGKGDGKEPGRNHSEEDAAQAERKERKRGGRPC